MKRQHKRQPRSQSSRLFYGRLEPRQLLAGDILGAHQVAGQVPSGSNLVVNGDFEDISSTATDNFHTNAEIAGWSGIDAATGQEINVFQYDSSYGNVLDLDSRSNVFDRVYQDLDTEIGTEYLIAFDFSNHPTEDPNATANTHGFQVWWNDVLMATYTGTETWQTGVISVQAGDSDFTRLQFSELEEGVNNGGDGRGALLDNIRVIRATERTVANGSFEINSEDRDLFYRPWEVDNWSAMGAEVTDRWLKIVEQDSTLATDGTQYLNLDATESTRDIVFTDLATTVGATYFVTFDMRTDGDPATDADELRVRWETPSTVAGDNSGWATTIKGNANWQTYGVVVTATGDQMRLEFLEPGSHNGDGSGPLIDNVRLFELPVESIQLDANGAADGVTGTAVFVPGAGAQSASPDITLSHPGAGNITGALIALTGIEDGVNEVISVNDAAIPVDASGNAKITVSTYDPTSGHLTLSGQATAAEYQQVLQSLVYFNVADEVTASDRTLTISVTDENLPAVRATTSTAVVLEIETDQAVIDDVILQKYIADNNLTVEQLGPMYYVIDDPGSGLNPTINDFVDVDYTGYTLQLNSQNELERAAPFESNIGAQFQLSRVIRGWQEGIPLLRTGGVGTLLIPSAWAYGTTGTPNGDFVNEVLIFDVELNQIL